MIPRQNDLGLKQGASRAVLSFLALSLLGALPTKAQTPDLPGARAGSTVRITVAPPASEAPVPAPLATAPVEPAPAATAPAATASIDVPKPQEVAPAVEVAPVPAPVPVAAIVEEIAIRAYLAPRQAKFRLNAEEVNAFVAAYAARGGKPYFVDEALALSPKIEAIAATLAAAGSEGLDAPRLVAQLPALRRGTVEAAQRVETDLAAAFAAFLYARDARGGRIEPSRLSGLITPTLHLPAPGELLDAIERAPLGSVAGVLEGYAPQHAGYKRLKAELARLNEPAQPVITANVASAAGAEAPKAALPADFMAGGPLKLGQADPRVPNLRIRLNMPPSASNVFDEDVKKALIAFQKAHELTANGWLTPRTRAALESHDTSPTGAPMTLDKRAERNAVLVNMERWRWLPPDLGARHILVNIPAFQLKFIENGVVTHETRVIVGRPDTQTPVFSDQFAHVIVNPSWYVPPSIIKKEFLPKLASDPGYAARRGFEVVQTRHGLSVRQPPGERNALGHIKFIFPNRHSVYLHDTSSRGLFVNETRAFSHGCVRVDKPFALAEKMLSRSGGFSEGQLRAMVGRGERLIKMEDKVGVNLSYFTLVMDESGTAHRYRDIYGHDSRVRAALNL